MNVAMALLIAATVTNGVAAGATFDQAFKQLPARRRIGAGAYTAYVRAADLSNGLVWYPIMGVSNAVVTVAAVVGGLLDKPTGAEIAALMVMAAGTAGFLAATSRAAPTLLSLRRREVPDGAGAVLDRFARINAVRAAALAVTLAATVWALVLASR